MFWLTEEDVKDTEKLVEVMDPNKTAQYILGLRESMHKILFRTMLNSGYPEEVAIKAVLGDLAKTREFIKTVLKIAKDKPESLDVDSTKKELDDMLDQFRKSNDSNN